MLPEVGPPDAPAGRQGGEHRIEPCDDILVTTNHQAEAALESPYAAARAHVHVADAARRQARVTGNVILKKGVASVDDHVLRSKERNQLIEQRVNCPDWNHHTEHARRREPGNEVGERRGAGRTLCDE